MQRHAWVLWTFLPLVLFAGIWWLTSTRTDPTAPGMDFVGNERATGPVPTRAERDLLTAEAQNACRCARRLPTGSPSRQACWAHFEQSINRYQHDESATACMPLAPTLVCFGSSLGHQDCIVRDHDGGACTPDEARTLEAIWEETTGPNPSSQQLSERAGERMQAAVQGFIRGERVAVRQTSGGCSG